MKKKFTTNLQEETIAWLKRQALEMEIKTGKKVSAADIIENLIEKEIRKMEKSFIKRVEEANSWDEIEASEYRDELEAVGLDYDKYDDPDIMWEAYLNAVKKA